MSLLAGVQVLAQTGLVATLSHGTSIQEFYGVDALVEAVAAAADGDVVTLSSGTFTATNIDKAITLRGAGMMNNGEGGITPTYLSGNFTICVPSESEMGVVIEGVRSTADIKLTTAMAKAVTFLKSCIGEISLYKAGNNSLNISQCIVNNITLDYNTNQQAMIDNSYVNYISTNGSININRGVLYVTMSNCILNKYQSHLNTYNHELLENFSMNNSIICSVEKSNDEAVVPVESHSFFHCICLDEGNTTFFSNTDESAGNTYVAEDIFKNPVNVASLSETFQLTDDAATTYRGDDGKQVGVYGGASPFNPTPTNPQISKFTVSCTKDGGQLRVKIDVE